MDGTRNTYEYNDLLGLINTLAEQISIVNYALNIVVKDNKKIHAELQQLKEQSIKN